MNDKSNSSDDKHNNNDKNNYNKRKNNNSNKNGNNTATQVAIKVQTIRNEETLILKWK